MGQVLPGSARTTPAVRRSILRSQQSRQPLAKRHSLDPKTGAKWRKRTPTTDAPVGPKPAWTVLTTHEEAITVAFRQHMLRPFDDCWSARPVTIPPPRTRAALHRCFQGHGASRLPLREDGQATPKKKVKDCPIGYLPLDFAQVPAEAGR